MKRLNDYCGICSHEDAYREAKEWREKQSFDSAIENMMEAFEIQCEVCGLGLVPMIHEDTDFTTGNGWETLSAAITAKGEMENFIMWMVSREYDEVSQFILAAEEVIFHRKPADEKSRIFDSYLEDV